MDNTEYIEITGKDIDSPEKMDSFIELFGRNQLIKAMREMSVQVHGDGAIEKIDAKIMALDQSAENYDSKYEKLINLKTKEGERLTDPENAVYKLPIGIEMDQHIFKKREKAREYLGVNRFSKIVYPMGEPAMTRANLRKFNPHLQEYEAQKAQAKARAKELENRRKEILKEAN